MMCITVGFTAGAAIGGFVSAWMMPLYGWRSVFIFGGAVPLVIALLMIWGMPESLQFLSVSGRNRDELARWLRKLDPTIRVDASTRFIANEERQTGAPFVHLFRDGRTVSTLLLWVVNFMNLLNLYFLSNWLPTIATGAGLSTQTAVLLGTALQAGGVAGTVLMGPAIDRIGFFKVLVPAFLLAALTIAAIGQPGVALPMLFLVVTVTGFCIIGGQPAVNALAATYYPTAERSTGVGWSLGIGRIGSIVGPVLAGELIRRNWSNSDIFMAMAVPTVISALMLVLFALDNRRITVSLAGGGSIAH
jgi:AAHS family 4-hydroxybenzoate transporter-like MFS transporter